MNKPKVSKAEAKYRDYPKGNQWCLKCNMFINRDGLCSTVAGEIDRQAWCKFFEGKK